MIAYIITGPECSGSSFIAQVVAHACGVDSVFQQWDGRGQLGEIGDKIIILHRSQPYGPECDFISLREFEGMYEGYELRFILTTRDRSISAVSNSKRRNRTPELQAEHEQRALTIMREIMASDHRFFVWSYETFMFLRHSYLQQLYLTFVETDTPFYPPDCSIVDANKKYVDI